MNSAVNQQAPPPAPPAPKHDVHVSVDPEGGDGENAEQEGRPWRFFWGGFLSGFLMCIAVFVLFCVFPDLQQKSRKRSYFIAGFALGFVCFIALNVALFVALYVVANSHA